MSNFLITKTPPKDLQEHEFVIGEPNFYTEIHQCKAKKPRTSQLTVNYIREVIAAICAKYMGPEFDVMRAINVSRLVGIPCNTEKEVHDALVQTFEKQCPQIILQYVQHCFKQRPSRTNLIYYAGNPLFCTKLVESGWVQLSQKEFDASKSDKPKKIIGKPAITDENAALLNT